MQDFRETQWSKHKYVRLDLRRHTLRFTVDLSGVQCDCAACLYLSLMPDPSDTTGDNYCGIRTPHGGPGGQVCTEIDLMEANVKAIQTTVHTEEGLQPDGTCNEVGCMVNWGNESTAAGGMPTSSLYGRRGVIDTAKPFSVSATFDASAALSVKLSQGRVTLPSFNVSAASNPNANGATKPTGVPIAAVNRTAASMAEGMVLVMSLWGGFSKLQGWLNGRCDADHPSCPWPPDNQQARFWGLELVDDHVWDD